MILVLRASQCYLDAGASVSDSAHKCSLGVTGSQNQTLGPPKKPGCSVFPRAGTWEGCLWARMVVFCSGKYAELIEPNGQIQLEGPIINQQARGKHFTPQVQVKRLTEGSAILRHGQEKGTNRMTAGHPPRDQG